MPRHQRMPRPEWHVVLEPWEIGCLFFLPKKASLCTEEHLLLGHFRGASCVSAAPIPAGRTGQLCTPHPPSPTGAFEGKTDMHVSEKAPSVGFPLDLCPHPERKTTYGLIIAVNTTVTVVQLLLCAGHGTRPFLRLQTLTVAPPTPAGPLTSALLQMQKPSGRECRTARPQASGAGAELGAWSELGSIVCQPFTPTNVDPVCTLSSLLYFILPSRCGLRKLLCEPLL